MTAAILHLPNLLAHGVRRLAVVGAEAATTVKVHMNRVNGGMPAITEGGRDISVQVEAVDGPFAGTTIATGTPREMHAWLVGNGYQPTVALAAHTKPVTAGTWVKPAEAVQ